VLHTCENCFTVPSYTVLFTPQTMFPNVPAARYKTPMYFKMLDNTGR
jgi:hypothetical protein